MHKIVVFVPEQDCDKVKASMFEAGAGKIGNYDCCCFELKGTGQFRPLAGSNPYLGKFQQLEKVEEVRVEMVCDDEYIAPVIKAMRSSHPYEEPAFDVVALANHLFE